MNYLYNKTLEIYDIKSFKKIAIVENVNLEQIRKKRILALK